MNNKCKSAIVCVGLLSFLVQPCCAAAQGREAGLAREKARQRLSRVRVVSICENVAGSVDIGRPMAEIRDELLQIIWSIWDHVKNHCPKLSPEAANYKLTWVGHVVGKRESRRLIGDYVMTEHDVADRTLFPDRVSYCGWGIDIHPPGGFCKLHNTTPRGVYQNYISDLQQQLLKDGCAGQGQADDGHMRGPRLRGGSITENRTDTILEVFP